MNDTFKDKYKPKKSNYIVIMLLILLSILIIILSLSSFITTAKIGNELKTKKTLTLITKDKEIKINAEVALTEKEQKTGLMYRNSLGKDNGMIFIFDSEKPQAFWMKNTLIPLDIIFFDKDGILLNIADAVPCKVPDNECPNYYSSGNTKYVLEMNEGWSKENGVEVGDRLDIGEL